MLPMLLSGCGVFYIHRKLPVPRAPEVTRNATATQLVESLNKHWAALDTLVAKVEIQASSFKSQQGMATDYTAIPGNILMRKPGMLHVLGRFPVVNTRAFEMVSDGKDFTLWIPTRSKAYKGSNGHKSKKNAANKLESMRPDFFFDALVVRGLDADDLYTVTADTVTVEDAKKKHLYAFPEYVLSIMRKKQGTPELIPERVVRFHRDDLLPYQQDIYDDDGNLETQVNYAGYADFGNGKYPSQVTIKRPQEEVQIVLSVEKVTENMALTDEQFLLKIPENTEIKKLD
jgi:outer membrane lipoprotein-sorting protein